MCIRDSSINLTQYRVVSYLKLLFYKIFTQNIFLGRKVLFFIGNSDFFPLFWRGFFWLAISKIALGTRNQIENI